MSHPPYKKRKPKARPGLLARQYAAQWLGLIMHQKRSMDEILTEAQRDEAYVALEARDKAFARHMLMTVLRHHGELSCLLSSFIQKPPAKKTGVMEILKIGAAQLFYMDVPPHAAIDLAVAAAKSSDKSQHLSKLVNAVLRRCSREGAEKLKSASNPAQNIPPIILSRWQAHYGKAQTDLMIEAMLSEPALDLNFPSGSDEWAEKLHGVRLLGRGVRLSQKGAISEIDGFNEGAWWVQDFSAQMPTALLGDVNGLRIADLCAAPGGKTAALASAGAKVTAVDISAVRLKRLEENLERLNLKDAVEVICADVMTFEAETKFDVVLLDAPCSATGTIRRHPDILLTKTEAKFDSVVDLQKRLIKRALELLKPEGVLLYCTCSLEAEEGEEQIDNFLNEHSHIKRLPFSTKDVFGQAHWLTEAGDVRLLPHYTAVAIEDESWDEGGQATGMDGFFISRLKV